MATHSSVLAWRIPGTGEPGGLPSMGSHRVGHDRSDLVVVVVIFHCVYIPYLLCSFLCQWRFRLLQITPYLCCCWSSVAKLYPLLCDPMNCSTPGFPVLYHLLEFAQTHVHWISDVIQPSHPLFSPSPLALRLSQMKVFSNESAVHIWWPKYWSFSFNISHSNEYSELISLRIDWFDLLAIQGTLKSLLQYHNLKISSLALSLLYDPTLTFVHDYWKNHSFYYLELCQQRGVSIF